MDCRSAELLPGTAVLPIMDGITPGFPIIGIGEIEFMPRSMLSFGGTSGGESDSRGHLGNGVKTFFKLAFSRLIKYTNKLNPATTATTIARTMNKMGDNVDGRLSVADGLVDGANVISLVTDTVVVICTALLVLGLWLVVVVVVTTLAVVVGIINAVVAVVVSVASNLDATEESVKFDISFAV